MSNLQHLFASNRAWAERIRKQDPDFFTKLGQQQRPDYLWIGCADSRVPANEIVGLLPGELFVHRNVANIVVHTDLNCLSVMHFAVDILKVRHIMVTGHYGCSGIQVTLRGQRVGLSDNWLRHADDVRKKHQTYLDSLPDEQVMFDRFCEINVIEQVLNVCQTTIARDAWERGQDLTVHALIYGIKDGILRDLNFEVDSYENAVPAYQNALAKLREA